MRCVEGAICQAVIQGIVQVDDRTGVWAQISVDEQLGLAYLPVELPTGDYFGANRPGNNLFGESIVAVDLQTGKRKWHYQLVHHGLWGTPENTAFLTTTLARYHGGLATSSSKLTPPESEDYTHKRPTRRTLSWAKIGAEPALSRP